MSAITGAKLQNGRRARKRKVSKKKIYPYMVHCNTNLSDPIRTLKSGHDKGTHNGHDEDTITLSGRGNYLIAMVDCMLALHSYLNIYLSELSG